MPLFFIALVVFGGALVIAGLWRNVYVWMVGMFVVLAAPLALQYTQYQSLTLERDRRAQIQKGALAATQADRDWATNTINTLYTGSQVECVDKGGTVHSDTVYLLVMFPFTKHTCTANGEIYTVSNITTSRVAERRTALAHFLDQ